MKVRVELDLSDMSLKELQNLAADVSLEAEYRETDYHLNQPSHEELQTWREGGKILAIKMHRSRTGCTLKMSKSILEHYGNA